MKRVLLLATLAIGAANADIIPNLSVGPGAVSCDFDMGLMANVCTYNYTATLHSETKVTGAIDEAEYFTIYDFDGYIALSGVAPSDWVFSTAAVGLTPSMIGIGAGDDSTVANLTFTYVGTVDITDARTISGFQAKSLFGPSTVQDWYSSQAHKKGVTPAGLVQNVGPVQVPQPPQSEPGDSPSPCRWCFWVAGLLSWDFCPGVSEKVSILALLLERKGPYGTPYLVWPPGLSSLFYLSK